MECGSSSVGRVSAFQADCREFESRLPLHYKKQEMTSCFLHYEGKYEKDIINLITFNSFN